jgi:mono/diheme cytochrome c family protein
VSALLAGCSWFTDFKQQPKLDPWETAADTIAMRANPQFSVPIYGTAAPGFAYGRMPSIPAIDSMSAIANPVQPDQRSLRNGHLQYSINCAVCHGDRGAGNGPLVAGGFGFPPIVIGAGSRAATVLTDGYVFGIIRNGRGLMPPYNRIEEVDRWDLINYLRALQRDSTTPAGAIARPGITGEFVPGASQSAPTRPAPHFRPAAPTTPPSPPGQPAQSAPAPHTP